MVDALVSHVVDVGHVRGCPGPLASHGTVPLLGLPAHRRDELGQALTWPMARVLSIC